MAFTYSGDPSASDLDMFRFIIGDTDQSDPRVTDEEANAYLNITKTVNEAVIGCVRGLVAKYAGECDYKIGPEQVTASQRYAQYKSLYNFLQAELTIGSTLPQVEIAKPLFTVGFMDNRRC